MSCPQLCQSSCGLWPSPAALNIDRFIGTADFISSRMAFNLFAAAREVDAERCSPSDMKRSLDAACERAAIRRQQPHRESRPIWRGAGAGKTSAAISRGFDLRDLRKAIRWRD